MFAVPSLGPAFRLLFDPSVPATAARLTCALLGLVGIPAIGQAQAQSLAHWKGAIFRPSSGTWSVQTPPGGGLQLSNLGSSGLDGCEFLLPPAAGTGVPAEAKIDLALIDPTGTQLPVGSALQFASRGTVGGLADQPIGTLRLEKQPGGRILHTYDFSAIGASSYTFEFYHDMTLVGVATGVVGTLGGGPALLPNCDASPHCCWLGAVYYSGGHWHNAWWCPMDVELNGNTYNSTNRVVVTPENPTMPVDELSGGAIYAEQMATIELADLTLTGFGDVGASYCSAASNSTGSPGILTAVGSDRVADNRLSVYAFQLPQNSFGYFITSRSQAYVTNAGGSQGNLCVGLGTGRYLSQLGSTGVNGALVLEVDLTAVPQPMGSSAVTVGETRNFQCWHRDANPTPTSNFTEGYAITFR